MRGREEAAGGQRVGDAERGFLLGVREAGLAVSRAHFFPAVSQSVNRSTSFGASRLDAYDVTCAGVVVSPPGLHLLLASCRPRRHV